jgi:hypothetical protein
VPCGDRERVPGWYPVVLVAGLVVQGVGSGRVLDVLQAASALTLTVLAWFLLTDPET